MQAPPRTDSSFFSSTYGILAVISSCCSLPKGSHAFFSHYYRYENNGKSLSQLSTTPIRNRIDYGFKPYTHGFIKSGQGFTSVEKMIHSESHSIALPESKMYVLKRLTSLLLSWYNPFLAEPPFSSVHRVKMECRTRTGANS
ncbi:hypothetical protein Gotri_026038 [Gossypium trilobum]|uniref:Uncharacterized protein n=1 Tax=Gossypium trilobum TaxID=34281 RepID=A0A7J9FKA5_9ROSI|nr:hypothetical protein [Gossypium trilobum]